MSGGLDAAPGWIGAHTELIREGAAWVGVSAQAVGVESGPGILGPSGAGLKMTDRQRYGSPMHPGDSFSYDIFSQAGEAIRHPAGVRAIGGLTPAVGKATNRAVRAGFVLKSDAQLIKAAAAESDIGK